MTPRIIAAIAAIVFIIAVFTLGPAACQKIRSMGAQARMDHSQADAAQDSAKDAINATAAAGARETASEDMTRTNGEAIKAAPGANVRVDAGANLAGRASLCRRISYRDDPKCAMFKGVK